jgi:hypothetical protein
MIYEIASSKNKPPRLLKASTLKAHGWSEDELKEYLFQYLPELVGPDLMIIGQSTPYKPEVDLLALDCDADLWLFELKAVKSTAENLLQVMRYSQSYSSFSLDELGDVFAHHKKIHAKSIAVAFCEYFGYRYPSAVEEWGARIGKKHHMVVMTDGADEETITATGHWQRHGLDIRAWTYRIYEGQEGRFHIELPELYLSGKRISSTPPCVFVLNTCRRYGTAHESYMFKHQVALATEPAWMQKINRISGGAKILLWRNDEGVKALGIATPHREDAMLGSSPMRFVKLRDFRMLENPITFSEAGKICEKSLAIRHTLFQIQGEAGDKLWGEALKRASAI